MDKNILLAEKNLSDLKEANARIRELIIRSSILVTIMATTVSERSTLTKK